MSCIENKAGIERLLWQFAIEKPIFVIPGHGCQSPELIARASESGCLGVLTAVFMSGKEIREQVKRIRSLTSKPFAVLIAPEKKTRLDEKKLELLDRALAPVREDLGVRIQRPLQVPQFEEQFQAVLESDVPIIGVTTGGLREPYMEALEEKGVVTFGVASNLKDAKVLVSSGVKAIVAQGWAAPGLRSYCETSFEGSMIDSLTLFSELWRAMKVPFVADISVMTRESARATMASGAAGVVVNDALNHCTDLDGIAQNWKRSLAYMPSSASQVTSIGNGHPSRLLNTGIIETIRENELPVLDFPYQWFALRDIFEHAVKTQSLELAYLEWGQTAYAAKSGTFDQIINEINSWIVE